MLKQPYLALYTGDWKKDPELSLCSPATRGIWIDLLCSIHDGHIGQVTGTPQQLARTCRCDVAEMDHALHELADTGTANVQQRDGTYTVLCRRMKKAADITLCRQLAGSKRAAKVEQTPDIEIDNGIGTENGTESDGLGRVREFARGEGINEADAEWFYWKGRGNGWTNGGKPILDWKATLRSWKRAGYLPSQKAKAMPQNGIGRPVRPLGKPTDIPSDFPNWFISQYPGRRDELSAWVDFNAVPRTFRESYWQWKKHPV